MAVTVPTQFVASEPIGATKLDLHRLAILELQGRHIARHRRTTSVAGATGTEQGVCWFSGAVKAGNLIKVFCTVNIYSGVAGQVLGCGLRYTVNGATPDPVNSPLMYGGWLAYSCAVAGIAESRVMIGEYTPASDCTLKVMLTYKRFVGSGDIRPYPDTTGNALNMGMVDYGVDLGSTGTNL